MQTSQLDNNARSLDFTGILVMLVVDTMSLYLLYGQTDAWYVILALAAAHLFTFILFTSSWGKASSSRRRILLWIEAIFIVGLYLLVGISFIAILGIIWIVQATELYDEKTAKFLLAGAILVFAGAFLTHAQSTTLLNVVISAITLGLFHVFAYAATRRAVRETQLREETAALNRELIATRDLLSQSTRQSERVRIARELHDLLGHHMTALILNLEVAVHFTEGKAHEKVEQSQSLAKLLLSDLRTAVSELRDDDQIDLLQSVQKLVAGIPGLVINVDFSRAPVIKDVELAETFLRCIQESITNIIKHSNASECHIVLSGSEQDYALSINDNGTGTSQIYPGNGLTGMSERVSANGGEMSWQRGSDGFSILVQLPGMA